MTDEKRKELLNLFLIENFKNDTVSQILTDNLPKYLYKYRSGASWDLEDLENNKLWMANATLLDDPYDSKFLITDKFYAQIEYVVNNIEHFKKPKYQIHLQNDAIQKECYLCSLSEICDSNDMWTRYSNNEKGFCIQYDTHKLIKNIQFPILPIYYDEKPMENANTLSKMSKTAMIFKNFLIKNKIGISGEDWHSQREWRIIAFEKMLEITPENSKGAYIDAIKPSKIIFGKDTPISLKNRIINWIDKPENNAILIEKRE